MVTMVRDFRIDSDQYQQSGTQCTYWKTCPKSCGFARTPVTCQPLPTLHRVRHGDVKNLQRVNGSVYLLLCIRCPPQASSLGEVRDKPTKSARRRTAIWRARWLPHCHSGQAAGNDHTIIDSPLGQRVHFSTVHADRRKPYIREPVVDTSAGHLRSSSK